MSETMVNGDKLITLKDLVAVKNEIISEVRRTNDVLKRKKWLKTKDVQKILGLSNGTLQSMRNKSEITFSKVGRTIYYLESEVDQMLERKSNKNEI